MSNHILIVDDEEDLRDIIRSFLELENHEVTEAASGNEAIKLVMSNSYDLILSDVRMPDGDGKDLLIKVKKEFSNSIPIIMITGFSGGVIQELEKIGANKVLSKPIDMDELVNEVDSLLNEK